MAQGIRWRIQGPLSRRVSVREKRGGWRMAESAIEGACELQMDIPGWKGVPLVRGFNVSTAYPGIPYSIFLFEL